MQCFLWCIIAILEIFLIVWLYRTFKSNTNSTLRNNNTLNKIDEVAVQQVDGFVALTRNQHGTLFGRFSNIMILYMNTIRLALLTDKRIVFLPLDARWLGTINIEVWSRMLDPSGPVCTINGKEWPRYGAIDNHTLAAAMDAKPQDWGPGCAVRPDKHIFHFFPLNSTVVSIGSNTYMYLSDSSYNFTNHASTHLTPVFNDDGKSFIQSNSSNTEAIDACVSNIGILSEPEPMFYLFDAWYLSSNSFLAVPYSPHVLGLASKFYSHIMRDSYSTQSGPLLCVHVRLEDLADETANWSSYIPHINAFIDRHKLPSSRSKESRILIITNGDENEQGQMKSDFPSAILGCFGLLKECHGDMGDPIYSAIEQETCSMADEFIGSWKSSFTYLIAMKRAHRGVHPGHRVDPSSNELQLIDHHNG
jgi:GDP-fucose protein O-fucosyltransferase